MVLSRGVKPSGTGWYSPTLPLATFSLRSTSTSIADLGAMLPLGPSSRHDARCAVPSPVSVVTFVHPPAIGSRSCILAPGPVPAVTPRTHPAQSKVRAWATRPRTYRGSIASSSQSRTMTRVPSSKFSSRKLSLGAWALQVGCVKPSSTTGSPREWSKAAVTGIEPPSRM